MYISIIFGKPKDDFLFYVMVCPVLSLAPSPIFRTFICLFISIFKILILKGISLRKITLISIIYISLNIYTIDYVISGYTSFLTLLTFFMYILIVMNKKVVEEINVKFLAWGIITSCAMMLFVIYQSSSGSLAEYAYSQNLQYRMGEEVRGLGGSMGMTLYGGMTIGCIVYLIEKGSKTSFEKIILAYLGVWTVFIEIFAVSRTFFITMCFIVVLTFLTIRKKNRKFGTLIFSGLTFVILGYFVFNKYSAYLLPMIEKLNVYMSSASSSSRVDIWLSALKYIFTDPFVFLFGNGAQSYMTLNKNINYSFWGYGAHNLFLDVLLAWGWIGFSLVVTIVFHTFFNRRNNFSVRYATLIDLIPLLSWIFLMMAQGSLRENTSYMYMIAVLIIAAKSGRKADRRRNNG